MKIPIQISIVPIAKTDKIVILGDHCSFLYGIVWYAVYLLLLLHSLRNIVNTPLNYKNKSKTEEKLDHFPLTYKAGCNLWSK